MAGCRDHIIYRGADLVQIRGKSERDLRFGLGLKHLCQIKDSFIGNRHVVEQYAEFGLINVESTSSCAFTALAVSPTFRPTMRRPPACEARVLIAWTA